MLSQNLSNIFTKPLCLRKWECLTHLQIARALYSYVLLLDLLKVQNFSRKLKALADHIKLSLFF